MTAFLCAQRVQRWAATGAQIILVAAVYYGAAKLGWLLGPHRVTPLWPGTGVALVSLLLLGVRVWPGITLGAFLANLTLGLPLAGVVAFAAGLTLAPVCAYVLLKAVGFHMDLDRIRDVLALVLLGGLAGMLISASVGAGALVLTGASPVDRFWTIWSEWWTGDALGILVITPLLLVIRKFRRPRHVSPCRWAEAAALMLGTTAAAVTVTRLPFAWHLLFLVFPFLIWAALRFGIGGAALCALVVSTVAGYAAVHGAGPFAGGDFVTRMVTLQAFNGVATFTALLLAAVVTERDRAHQELQDATSQLAEGVARLSRSSAYKGRALDAVLRGARGSEGR